LPLVPLLVQGQATEPQTLSGHLPAWATAANLSASLPDHEPMEAMTVVLSPTAERRQALESLLAGQQEPHSSLFHRWLTPEEFGRRFGAGEQEIAGVTGWLQSQGLRVNWISPGRNLIGFTGTAGDVGRAFGTQMRRYRVNGRERIAPSSEPKIPAALAPAIKAIRGLYTIEERPMHHARAVSAQPAFADTDGNHYIAPTDFATIYDLPSSLDGLQVSIGIVGLSRTDSDDFLMFRDLGYPLATLQEIVPPGGVDPGPPFTAPPGASDEAQLDDQLEATLDVTRAGSIAPNSSLLLVVSTAASGGIGLDTEYLVNTTPLPAQIISISFGACESEAGSSGVKYWDTLFQQAAAEGISVFVASGDAGASGCDAYFGTPPAAPQPNSPNYICSSSYATCVGGTEFADAANPSLYWSGSSTGNALSYIPEGGWNEPMDGTTPVVAASGGGVSGVISTPSWQTGTGVPSARSGRYTPDIAFSASCHDGYVGCFAAGGASCVTQSNGEYSFESLCGTSAAAPDMAGITALLDQQLGEGQGNLNPELYTLAASSSSAFHDATPATSSVSGCSLATPSMCNNSAPSSTGLTGGQQGYPLTVGYDEVTGLGSLDVARLIAAWPIPPTGQPATLSPASLSFANSTVQQVVQKTLTISNPGQKPLVISSISLSGSGASAFQASTSTSPTTIAAGGSCAITVTFYASAPGSYTATLAIADNASNSPQSVALSGAAFERTYTVLTASAQQAAMGATTTLTATVGDGYNPSGSVSFFSGTQLLGSAPLSGGQAVLANVALSAANGFVLGADTITATYSGDANNASSTGTAQIIVFNPALPVLLSVSPNQVVVDNSAVNITVQGANFTSGSVVLWNGMALATTYVSGTELTAAIPGSYATQSTVAPVTVANPSPAQAISCAQPFYMIDASRVPLISSASLASAPDSAGGYMLAVALENARDLGPDGAWNGTPLDFYGDTQGAWVSLSAASADALPATITIEESNGTSPGFLFR
jgi:subtilase family serine protease